MCILERITLHIRKCGEGAGVGQCSAAGSPTPALLTLCCGRLCCALYDVERHPWPMPIPYPSSSSSPSHLTPCCLAVATKPLCQIPLQHQNHPWWSATGLEAEKQALVSWTEGRGVWGRRAPIGSTLVQAHRQAHASGTVVLRILPV